MLEKRLSLVEELNIAASSLYSKQSLSALIASHSGIIPLFRAKQLNTLNHSGEYNQVLDQLYSILKTYDSKNRGNTQIPKLELFRKELKTTAQNIKEYRLSSATNLSINDIRHILGFMSLGDKFENRSLEELHDFMEEVHDSIYLGSNISGSDLSKFFKTSELADVFYRACHAWPVKILGKLNAIEVLYRSAQVITQNGNLAKSSMQILKDNISSFPVEKQDMVTRLLVSIGGQLEGLIVLDPEILKIQDIVDPVKIERLRSSFVKIKPNLNVVLSKLITTTLNLIAEVNEPKQRESLTSLVQNLNEQIGRTVEARVLLGQGLDVVESTGLSPLQAAQMMKYIVNIFNEAQDRYAAVLTSLATYCLRSFINNDPKTDLAARSLLIRTLESVILREDNPGSIQKFLAQVLENIKLYSPHQKVSILIGMADLKMGGNEGAQALIAGLRDQIVEKVCADLNETKQHFSIPKILKRQLIELPKEVAKKLSKSFWSKVGIFALRHPELVKEIKNIEQLNKAVDLFVTTFVNPKTRLPALAEIGELFAKIDDYHNKANLAEKKVVRELFEQKILATLLKREKDIVNNWDLIEIVSLLQYMNAYNIKVDKPLENFLVRLLKFKLKDELENSFSNIVKVSNKIPEKYAKFTDPVFKEFSDKAFNTRCSDYNSSIDFFVEISNLFAAARIDDVIKKGKPLSSITASHKTTNLDAKTQNYLKAKIREAHSKVEAFYASGDNKIEPHLVESFKMAIVQSQYQCWGQSFPQDVLKHVGISSFGKWNNLPVLWANVDTGYLLRIGQKVGANYVKDLVAHANSNLANGQTYTQEGMKFSVTFDIDHTLRVRAVTSDGKKVVSNLAM